MITLRYCTRMAKRIIGWTMVVLVGYNAIASVFAPHDRTRPTPRSIIKASTLPHAKLPQAPKENHKLIEILKKREASYRRESIDSKKIVANMRQLPSMEQSIQRTAPLNDNIFEEKDMVDEYGKPYKIVIWFGGRGKPQYVANPEVCFGNISCETTFSAKGIQDAHAVVFKAESVFLSFPKERKQNQLYAWWTAESLFHTLVPLPRLDGAFNLTFHYRTDADVYAPYGSMNLILTELKKAGETDLEILLEKKRKSNKMAIWAVSNCYSKRMDYGKSLIKAGLDVDTYGACFGHRELGKGKSSDSMYEAISEYKFYFAFENSVNCKDYITEKFWFNGLRSGAVPIVWGPNKNDLLKVAPTKSFIHANDFSNPQELVIYLKYLARNETAYAEYLQWRTWIKHPERIETRLRMENRDNDMRSYCKLCSILQADGRRRKLGIPNPPRIVPSIKAAWFSRDLECRV